MTMEERKAKGLLWTDTPEAMEAQARARGLVYDFNHTRPEEKEKRMELLQQIFGSLGNRLLPWHLAKQFPSGTTHISTLI